MIDRGFWLYVTYQAGPSCRKCLAGKPSIVMMARASDFHFAAHESLPNQKAAVSLKPLNIDGGRHGAGGGP